MDFAIDPEEEGFRTEVRRFIATQPASLVRGRPSGYIHSRAERELWIRALNRQGWLVPHWTSAWGGRPWSAVQRYILQDELCAAGCPEVDGIAIHLVGPILQTFGSLAQQKRYLPGILTGAEFWCQGFSEPEAGSDLSRVHTIATQRGHRYSVSGRKTWITQAHIADWMFALVRVKANGELQQGLSFVLIDMHAPGVSTRPIITLDGRHHINEVLLDEVDVPGENLIGEEGKGWTYARALLERERSSSSGLSHTKIDLKRLEEIASRQDFTGCLLKNSPLFHQKLAGLQHEVMALEYLNLRVLNVGAQNQQAEVLGSILKYRGAEAYQLASELMLEALGEQAIEYFPDAGSLLPHCVGGTPGDLAGIAASYLFRRSATIAAGTTEVQKNIIAALGLGL